MRRQDRLMQLIRILRSGGVHRAADLARALGVSGRTLYRDMEGLAAAGVPVEGTRGAGYSLRGDIALPPLSLSQEELDALNLGIAIVAEAADPALKAAARSLGAKLDNALPAETIAEAEAWKTALSPLSVPARSLALMPMMRAAISARQKLDVSYHAPDGGLARHRVRPLRLASFGRVWILTCWSETAGDFREFRADLIEEALPLPELFVDEPGRRLGDFPAR